MTTPIYTPPFKLRFTNTWGEKYWFCNLGLMWPNNPTRRLIERTTANAAEAREFTTPEEANETLVVAGQPSGWEVMDAEGRVVE